MRTIKTDMNRPAVCLPYLCVAPLKAVNVTSHLYHPRHSCHAACVNRHITKTMVLQDTILHTLTAAMLSRLPGSPLLPACTAITAVRLSRYARIQWCFMLPPARQCAQSPVS